MRTPAGDAGPALTGLPHRGPLFPLPSSEPYRNFAANFVRVARAVERAERGAGCPFVRFRVHDLRHGFAILWLSAGGDIHALSLHLGHNSVKVTEIYLGHVTARQQAAAKGARNRQRRVVQTGAQ